MIVLFDYFHPWDALEDMMLTEEEERHSWRFDGLQQFSSKSDYRAVFNGATSFEPWKLIIWKTTGTG
jgi:hypothetical protein